jgi:hypothetical protein
VYQVFPVCLCLQPALAIETLLHLALGRIESLTL